MVKKIAIILKIVIFFIIIRVHTHNLDIIMYTLSTFVQYHLDLLSFFFKVYKFRFLMLYWKHKRKIADVEYAILVLKHDFNLLAKYFEEIATVTIKALIAKVLKSCLNPLSFISLLWFVNFITLPYTISLELLIDAFYPPIKELDLDTILLEISSNKDINSAFSPSSTISKEEEENLNKILGGVKTKDGILDTKDTAFDKQKENAFRENLKSYNLHTAYLCFCVASVIICQALKARGGGGGGD